MKKYKTITWDSLPKNIQKVMIKNYIMQRKGIYEGIDIIKDAVYSYKCNLQGGFFWDLSPEKGAFWREILIQDNITYFRQYYKNNTNQYLIDYGYF